MMSAHTRIAPLSLLVAACFAAAPLQAGELVTAKHIETMLKEQDLGRRGILPQREKGSAGSAVRPVAIGVPGK